MELTESALYDEIEAVVKSPAKPVHFTWSGEVHLPDGTIAYAFKVLSIDDLREYDTKYAPEVMVEMTFGLGTYAFDIYPNKDNLEVMLTCTPVAEIGGTVDDTQQPQSYLYTATLVDKGNIALEHNGPNTPSREALNLVDAPAFEFQLVDKATEQLRMRSTGANYRNCTVQDVVMTVLTNESKLIDVDDAVKPKGVVMVDASNQNKRDHVIVPQGMKLVNVPNYIQVKQGGIYSSGLGYFLQNQYWYVYPCYDVNRFNDAKDTLTVINVPRNRFPSSERTYLVDGSHVTVLATGEVRFSDDSAVKQLNDGNGARFADADQFNGSFVKTGNNKAIVSRAQNNSEFISVQRENKLNNVLQSKTPITANPYEQYSQLARRQGAFFQMTWENANINLLIPGMMTKIQYLDGDDVVEIYGTLMKVHGYTHLLGEGQTSTQYQNLAVLVFFVTKPTVDVNNE